MKVALVEDDLQAASLFTAHLKRFGEETKTELEAVHYTDAQAFLQAYDKVRPSIVFFDIDLPSINGMEAARRLRARDDTVVILFLTKMSQYAKDGYSVGALEYMTKPVGFPEFRLKMQRAVNVARASEVKTIHIPVDGGFYRVQADKLVYVEVTGHRLVYHTVDQEIEARGSLSDLEKSLAAHGFLRCSNCYLVNARYIDSVKGYDLFLYGHTLQISHPRRKEFMKRLMDYYTGSGPQGNGGNA